MRFTLIYFVWFVSFYLRMSHSKRFLSFQCNYIYRLLLHGLHGNWAQLSSRRWVVATTKNTQFFLLLLLIVYVFSATAWVESTLNSCCIWKSDASLRFVLYTFIYIWIKMNHLLAFHTESYVYVFGVWIECVYVWFPHYVWVNTFCYAVIPDLAFSTIIMWYMTLSIMGMLL